MIQQKKSIALTLLVGNPEAPRQRRVIAYRRRRLTKKLPIGVRVCFVFCAAVLPWAGILWAILR